MNGPHRLFLKDRLNTVLDSDRILVLDNGSVAELDTPKHLLDDPKTLFYALAAEAGLAGSQL